MVRATPMRTWSAAKRGESTAEAASHSTTEDNRYDHSRPHAPTIDTARRCVGLLASLTIASSRSSAPGRRRMPGRRSGKLAAAVASGRIQASLYITCCSSAWQIVRETNRIGRIELKPSDLILRRRVAPSRRPHPEELGALLCAPSVSKDGRWLGFASGQPSRRAQSFEARAPSGARAPQDEVRAPQDEVD